MKKKRSAQSPSQLETTILSLLWESEGMTAREVLDAIPDDKKRAYTSVLSVLQAMEKKELVHHTRRGTAHVYHANVERREVIGPFIRTMVKNFFGGRPSMALQQLMDETEIDAEELREINRIIRKHGKDAR